MVYHVFLLEPEVPVGGMQRLEGVPQAGMAGMQLPQLVRCIRILLRLNL